MRFKLFRYKISIVHAAKLCIAFATLATYAIEFYVLMQIIGNSILRNLPKCIKIVIEYIIRIALVVTQTISFYILKFGKKQTFFNFLKIIFQTLTVALTYYTHQWIPTFYLSISMLCLSMLTLILPMFIQILTYYTETVDYCHFSWILLKNLCLIVVGIAALVNAVQLLKQNIQTVNNFE